MKQKIREERFKKSMVKVMKQEADREWDKLMQKMEAGEDVTELILEIHNQGGNFSKVFFGKEVNINLNSTNFS